VELSSHATLVPSSFFSIWQESKKAYTILVSCYIRCLWRHSSPTNGLLFTSWLDVNAKPEISRPASYSYLTASIISMAGHFTQPPGSRRGGHSHPHPRMPKGVTAGSMGEPPGIHCSSAAGQHSPTFAEKKKTALELACHHCMIKKVGGVS